MDGDVIAITHSETQHQGGPGISGSVKNCRGPPRCFAVRGAFVIRCRFPCGRLPIRFAYSLPSIRSRDLGEGQIDHTGYEVSDRVSTASSPSSLSRRRMTLEELAREVALAKATKRESKRACPSIADLRSASSDA